MAVPESCPPVRVARNTMRMIAQTVIQGEGIHRSVVGRFRQSSKIDVLLAKETSLVLACPNEQGELVTQHTQPVHGTVLDVQVAPAPQHAKLGQAMDKVILLTSSGNLSVIHFDTQLHRFVALKQIPLIPAGMPNLLPPQSIQVHPCNQAIAVAGYNWVALLPTAAVDMSSTQDVPVLAVLPSFYSSQQKFPTQETPAQNTGTKLPAASPAADADNPQSQSRTYASDEAWLKAQTDSRRLEATWMTSDLGSVPDVVRHQQEQLHRHMPEASLPPSGLIRSICFVECGGVQHTLALAVLYYVSPDTGFTLDILQWAPRSTALCVKLRLQLHELADMHTFLLGCIVLDMCTIPTYQSGLVLMYESGVVMLDLADVTSGWLSDSDAAPQPDARLRCHSFAKGGQQSSKASMGVIFACKWAIGQSAAAPSSTAAPFEPQSADKEAVASASADQDGAVDDAADAASTSGLNGKEGEDDNEEWALNHLMSSPRLLTSWCWREKGVPAFSPSAPSSSGANGLHQELLLGFDVSPGCEHSVLSMTVERKQAADGSASTWSIDLQDTGFHPGATPTTMSSLPNQHIMFGSETGDGCTVKMPSAPKGVGVGRGARGSSGSSMMSAAAVSSVLHNAAPVWAFTVANLQSLPQDQVYAACGHSGNGSIRVMQADQTVDMLYKSGADYPGISGMWSLPPWPEAEFHSLLVLSFASGSRAMATGSTLKDVTESVGLDGNERTLACACLADRVLVQVMHKRMQLCSMDAVLSPDQGGLSCSPSGDRSRARLGVPLTLEDLEISTSEDTGQDGHFFTTEGGHLYMHPEGRPAWGYTPTPAVPTPASSEASPSGYGASCGISQVARGAEDVWAPPGGASISTAAAAEGVVVASCTHFKGLEAVQAVLCDEGAGGRPWSAGGVAQSPGKRKRTRKRWCLRHLAQFPLQDEVSCIHLLPYNQGGRGCNLVVAGTYKPGVQLLLLQGGDTHIGSSQQPCFLPLASVAISPLLRSAFQESFASPEEPPASPCKELPDQAIPESVQILPVDSSPQDIQVLVGLRNGTMLQLTASSEVMLTAAAQPPLLRRPLPQLQLTAIKQLGSLPVVLVPLPTAAGLVGASLALSDRMALLSSAPGTGRAVASPLAVAGVTHAVPLWQPASSLSGNSISRFTVLCALSTGRLQLLDLQHQEHPHVRTLPLLPPARPAHLAVHPHKPVLLVACQGTDGIWELRCMHAVTGANLARFPMAAGECITSLCTWTRPHLAAPLPPNLRAAEPQQEPQDNREQDEEAISASGSGHAEAEEEDQCEEQSDVFVVVGTGEERGQQAGGTWNPCKGRLLLINFASKQNAIWLNPTAESKFADRVHAVAVLPECGLAPGHPGLLAPGILIAALGRRLVAFGEKQGRLLKHDLIATAQPVTCLSPNPSIKGRFVASNEMDSAMVYEFNLGTGLCMLQADSYSRPVTHCLAIQNPTPCQATVGAVDRQGRAFFLAPEPETFGPERNMYAAVQYCLGQTPAGIVQGNLRQAARDDTGGSGSETRAAGCSSSSCQEGALMSLSALPSAEASPVKVEGAGVGSATDPHDTPEITGRPEGSVTGLASMACLPHQADSIPAASNHSWVTVSTAGHVMQLSTLSRQQHQLLAALQHVMSRDPAVAPLSGCNLGQYRSAQDQASSRRQQQAEGPYIALDGDMLLQFLYLPTQKQKQLLAAKQVQEGHRRAANQAGPHSPASLPNIIQVLENALPLC